MRNGARREVLRTAVVGCGRMGQQHAKNTAALGHRVAIVCDVDAERAGLLARSHPGSRAMVDPAAIPWDEVDAAFICTPPFARGPVEERAARAGVALFLEKPIGLSASSGLGTLRAAVEEGVVTSVGYMNRYRASVRRARSLLAGQQVLGFSAHWVGAAYQVPWWSDPALSGGQINEQCTHVVDLARHLVGEVAEVDALAQPHPDGKGFASVSVALRFDTGALGTILCGCLAREKQIGCRVFTARGALSLEGWNFAWSPSPAFGDGADLGASQDVFLEECAAFLGAVASGSTEAIGCDLADALRTQQVVDAVRAALAARAQNRIEVTRLGGNHAVASL